LALA
jgi:hypothetical protein